MAGSCGAREYRVGGRRRMTAVVGPDAGRARRPALIAFCARSASAWSARARHTGRASCSERRSPPSDPARARAPIGPARAFPASRVGGRSATMRRPARTVRRSSPWCASGRACRSGRSRRRRDRALERVGRADTAGRRGRATARAAAGEAWGSPRRPAPGLPTLGRQHVGGAGERDDGQARWRNVRLSGSAATPAGSGATIARAGRVAHANGQDRSARLSCRCTVVREAVGRRDIPAASASVPNRGRFGHAAR